MDTEADISIANEFQKEEDESEVKKSVVRNEHVSTNNNQSQEAGTESNQHGQSKLMISNSQDSF